MKGIKGLWRLRHLGKSPIRILRGNTYAGVFGIGDNGLEAVNRLIKAMATRRRVCTYNDGRSVARAVVR